MQMLQRTVLAVAAVLFLAPSAGAADLAAEFKALKARVAEQTQALERARERNRRLEERVRALEKSIGSGAGRGVSVAGTASPAPGGDLAARVEAVETQAAVISAQQEGLLDRLARQTRVSGYAAVEVSDFEGRDADFELATLELLIDAAPSPRLSFRGEFEFEAVGSGDPDRGGHHADVEIEEAWAEYAITPWLRPRAGAVFSPLGRYTSEHFDTVQDLTSRPLMARRVIPTSWTETALGATGAVALPRVVSWLEEVGLEYELYAVNGLNDRLSDTSSRSARGALGGDNNGDKAFAGRLGLASPGRFDVGVSGYHGKYDANDDNGICGVDIDWDLQWKSLRVKGEYARLTIDDGIAASGLSTPGHMTGLYVEPSYSFWPRLLDDLGRRYMSNPRLTAVARWGFADIGDDGDAGSGDNREERLTLGLALRPADNLALKLEWQRNTTSREALEYGDADGFLASVATSF